MEKDLDKRSTEEENVKDIATKLIELGESYENKQELDFEWEQKNGLRYVSDESLELVYEILVNMQISLENKDTKVVIKNNLMNVCDFKTTTKELIEKIKNNKQEVTLEKPGIFTIDKRLTVNRICINCKFQRCPKHIAGYILYLIDKGQLKEKLEDRKKYREKNKELNDLFAFEWKFGDILRIIPDEMYTFCQTVVDRNYAYVARFLNNDEKYITIYTPFSCDDYKLMYGDLDKIKSENKDKNTWVMLRRLPDKEIRLCDSYSCGLPGCALAIIGILSYLKEMGREDFIKKERQYYSEHQEEMDKKLEEMIKQKHETIKENTAKSLEDVKKYKSKIDKFDELVYALENPNQENLHCTIEGDDYVEKTKLIKNISSFLFNSGKLNAEQYEKISLYNLAAGNAYNYGEDVKKGDVDRFGVPYKLEYGIKYTVLKEKKLYVVNNITEFINDYKVLDKKYNMTKQKQMKHVLNLLVETACANYIILDGTTKEIEELLTLDPKLQYIYQNYRFKFHEFDLEEAFKLYLKSLDNSIFNKIKDREYEYKKQFMEYISLNKNFIPFSNRELASYLAMYSNSKGDAILPDNIYKKETVEEALKNIVGLETVKEKVKEFEKYMLFKVKAESEGLKLENSNMHMIFTGNPGTGKTTIARIMAKMLFDMGIIQENKLIEVERKDLVAGYIGQTAQKTSEVIQDAMGGVLFIDEAYSLASGFKNDFGAEAVATLIKAMEDHKDKLVVIFAGYKDEMKNFLDINPGISSRIGYTFDFPDYDTNELVEIFYRKIKRMGFECRKECDVEIKKICAYFSQRKAFGNGRFVDKLVQETILKHAINENPVNKIEIDDIPSIRDLNNSSDNEETTEELLKNVIGLTDLKTKIKEFENYVKFIKEAEKKNINLPNQNMHMIFTGNPGTGKTTIARIMAKILYNAGIIQENKLIEVERKDLIAEYIGQTAPKTTEVIEKALGGVLFIDEAYSLASGTQNDFGAEAISTLIKAMEDHKGEFIVIFAGYKKEMGEFLNMNSGIASRIGYIFDFPDYTREELCEILYKKLEKCNLKIEENAKKKVFEIMNYFCNVENIGNGRFADKVLQSIILKHAANNSKDIETIVEKDIPTIKEMTDSLFNGEYMVNPEAIPEEALRNTAIHEIGHALVRYKLYKTPGIITITINPEGAGTLGYVKHKIAAGEYVRTKSILLNQIKVSLAGMAAEEIFCGEFANGNTSDLEKATAIAKNMITRYGMSRLGFGQIMELEGEMAVKVQEEINSILDECYKETCNIINENKEQMTKVIDYLLKQKEISEDEFINVFNKK